MTNHQPTFSSNSMCFSGFVSVLGLPVHQTGMQLPEGWILASFDDAVWLLTACLALAGKQQEFSSLFFHLLSRARGGECVHYIAYNACIFWQGLFLHQYHTPIH
jgi:hypothetical protein